MGLRLAVVGAGLIGKRHIAAIQASQAAELAAVVDPMSSAEALAVAHDAPWFALLEDMLAADQPDGVILATPSAMHLAGGLACIDAGLPVLIEKPLATNLAEARRLVDAAAGAGKPLLTGHHRRHNPLIAAAKSAIDAGAIGRPVSVNAMFWLYKPDDYFAAPWRREAGGGPVYLNLSHDIDLLRHLVGEIVEVSARESNAVRGAAVEESATIMLAFANGALGTVNVSDTIPAPWSWELTAGENAAYPNTGQACCLIGGTDGSLELPRNRLWRYTGEKSWWAPLAAETAPTRAGDPLVRQIDQFAAVIRGEAEPLVSGREGLLTLEVVDAVKRSAADGGAPVVLTRPG